MPSSDQGSLRESCTRHSKVCPRLPALALGIELEELTIREPDEALAEDRLTALVGILDHSLPLTSSPLASWDWASTIPIPSLGDRTALQLVRTGQAQAVINYLERIVAGGYAWQCVDHRLLGKTSRPAPIKPLNRNAVGPTLAPTDQVPLRCRPYAASAPCHGT